MEQTYSPSIFVPLVLIVMIELSSIARNTRYYGAVSDLELRAIITNPNHLLTTLFDRFAVIHFFNTIIIYATLTFTFLLAHGDTVSIILGFFLILFWVILPILESSDYDHLLEERFPVSYVYHIIATPIIGAIILGAFHTEYGIMIRTEFFFNVANYSVLFLSILHSWVFLLILRIDVTTKQRNSEL